MIAWKGQAIGATASATEARSKTLLRLGIMTLAAKILRLAQWANRNGVAIFLG
ncbi:hypothetical protein JQ607_01795 [Bradyrhizobium liaoningense]|uniref:hypothetical protein n=1 Tax=Bradyrhizobium liaoningense TaxID=43992 RepID=UPI001BA62CF3|nr:hypothetical protein [Bradyrhizobium liaoningense]MBR0838914.1 hypothetical protein [Bradyrhizobium liaoningense]